MSSGGGSAAAAAAAAPGPSLHPRPFKLRFAARQPRGRSHIAPSKPLKLPDIVTGKFYSRWEQPGTADRAAGGARAGGGVYGRTPYRLGPRELAASPQLSSHEYGWHWSVWADARAARRRDPRLHHALADPAWLQHRAKLLHYT